MRRTRSPRRHNGVMKTRNEPNSARTTLGRRTMTIRLLRLRVVIMQGRSVPFNVTHFTSLPSASPACLPHYGRRAFGIDWASHFAQCRLRFARLFTTLLGCRAFRFDVLSSLQLLEPQQVNKTHRKIVVSMQFLLVHCIPCLHLQATTNI